MPLAPPESLVLSENEFRPFKQQAGGIISPAVASSGDRLELRTGGAAGRAEFEAGALAEGLSKLLDPSVGTWREWAVSLDHVAIDRAATAKWLEEHRAWSVDVAAKRAQRAAEKAAAAAMEAATEAAAAAVAPAAVDCAQEAASVAAEQDQRA